MGMQTDRGTGSADKPTRRRYRILALIFASVVINYMDRVNLSVAATALSGDLSLGPVQMGLLFSAFGWTYALLQIPGGVVVDFVKTRLLYPLILAAWSTATVLQGVAGSFPGLLGCRLSIGVFEAPSYPCNNKIVTAWFPESERAGAIAVYTSGQFVGLAFLMPLLATVQSCFGWRGLFFASGAVGILWAVVWYMVYREPSEDKGANPAELVHIRSDAGTAAPAAPDGSPAFEWRRLAFALTQRKLWGIYIGQFCLGGTLIFFLTWFPTYLVEYRNLDFIKSGYMASIPFLAGFCGVLVSGFASDYMVRKGISREIARKAPVIAGMSLSMGIVGANYTQNTALIIAFLALAFFGNGLASITWVFVSLLSPAKTIGLVGGCFNFIGGLSAIVVPLAIGYLVKAGDFRPALLFISALAFLGVCSYLFVVGKIERIEADP